ncbi:MAG: hypothetical protein J7L61_01875 [Thermoplasmata archaeon]|nr:hypothetical protein [Thermoplasmata archaeon]
MTGERAGERRRYDGTTSGDEVEVRGFLSDPGRLFSVAEETGTYMLEDVFYFPMGLFPGGDPSGGVPFLEEGDVWHPRNTTLRLRTFSGKGTMILLSRQTYDRLLPGEGEPDGGLDEVGGTLKKAVKYIMASGAPEELEEILGLLGFAPAFSIRRREGHFLRVKVGGGTHPGKTQGLVAEYIEGLGWMFEAHVEQGEEKEVMSLLDFIGVEEGQLLKESLPSYYYKIVVLGNGVGNGGR